MKLLSCYIAGFGKFINRSFDFSSDLVVIKEDNGWGKTTLADFIRCMLYGQDASRSKALESNERVKYTPWGGGAYGGSLTFLYKNQKYRVERTFGKTPAYDSVRIFDGNNMQTFVFGDKGEKLGETLFGIDAEGYRRSVYMPQGDISTGDLPDNLKNRLLSLLNTGGTASAGAGNALEKLDAADRALRAKRRPAKGKLDEIDERLDSIARERSEKERGAIRVKSMRLQIGEMTKALDDCNARLTSVSEEIENQSRRNELELKKQAYDDAKQEYDRAEREVMQLEIFFGKTEPNTINLGGIHSAVQEYYDCKEKADEIDEKIQKNQQEYQEYLALQSKKEACEKILDSYDEILQRKGAGTRRKPKTKKIIPPKRKSNKWILCIGVLLAILGTVFIEKQLALGLGLVGIGVLFMAFVFLRCLPKTIKLEAEQKEDGIDPAISQKYDEAYEELDQVQEKLSKLPTSLGEEYPKWQEERKKLQGQLCAREQGIRNFLQNFHFGEIYDYRVATATLQDNITRHQTLLKTMEEKQERIRKLSAEGGAMQSAYNQDIFALKEKKRAIEQEKEEISEQRAKLSADAENLQRSVQEDGNLAVEEEELLQQKNRLEKRHRAILTAKRILERAQENLAGRYLEPVQKGCQYYMRLLSGQNADKLRFTAEGAQLFEESGILREIGYYSAGEKELVGLCTRIALADAVFQKELPCLVLDDPFVNLDDGKTEKAKRFIKELSKRYQILYLTCKQERTF